MTKLSNNVGLTVLLCSSLGVVGVAAAQESIEMTQNQVYGVSVSKDTGQGANIPTEANVGYTRDGKGAHHQSAQDDSYDYI